MRSKVPNNLPTETNGGGTFARFNRNLSLRSTFFIVTVLLILVSTYSGVRISHNQQVQEFSKDSQLLFTEATSKVVEIRSVMKSMLGMHYASDEFAGADIEAFASQLRQYSPSTHVQDLGMFEYIDASLRSEYEIWMQQQGLTGFTIHPLSNLPEESTAIAQALRDYPIISIDSPSGDKQRLLGLNLVSVPGFLERMDETTATGESFLLKAPDAWPSTGNLLLVQPAYFGGLHPDSQADRIELLAGGIWISIDTAQLLSSMEERGHSRLELLSGSRVNFELRLDQSDLVSRKSIDIGFETLSETRQWTLGVSPLSMTFVKEIGLPRKHWQVIAVIALFIAIFSLMIFTMISQWRLTQSERLASLRAISTERENAQRTLESISDAVIALNPQLDVVYVNPSALALLELSEENLLNHPVSKHLRLKGADDVHSESTPELTALIELLGDERREVDVQLDLPHLAGITVKMSVSRMPDDNGGYSGVILVLEDVSRERKLSSELEFRANHDALTGAYNRFYFDRRLAELTDDVSRSRREHALCYIDLDQFKVVNDTCGHSSGDRLLCELTESLQGKLRSGDVLARLGGDEFGIIICDCSRTNAINVAEKIYSFFQHFVFEHEGKAFQVHASIGFVEINKDNCDLKTVMSAADVACYMAKDSGRNALVVYSDTDESVSQHREEMDWLPRLKEALNEDKFQLLVQAIATINPGQAVAGTLKLIEPAGSVDKVLDVTTKISHYEFLIRLQDEDGSLITPYSFIKSAERYDLMRSIDRWVIKNAISTVKDVENQLTPSCVFSVNISGQSAADPTLLAYIEEQLEESGVNASRFWFEITETAAITHFSNAVTLIRGIQKLGAKVALDDFGSGLSSFAYLRNLPVDVLKIDGQFVKDVHDSDVAREMVRAIDHVGKSMGIKTVAEFVEDEKVLQVLATIGVDYAQGYFIAKPCTLEEAFRQGALLKAS